MIYSLLESGANNTNSTIGLIAIIVVVLGFAAILFFSNRKNKSRQQEYIEQLEAIAPGHKVKTVGGICGIVVEVCDDNTVIIETGSENSGKSYVKMDKELIAQTDAKGPTQIAREEAEARRKAEKEAKAAAKHGETPAQPSAETPVQPAQEAGEQPEQPVQDTQDEQP